MPTFPWLGGANSIPYATNVSAALAQIWLYDPSYALNEDPFVYEKQLKDLCVSGALDQLQLSIVGHSISFKPRKNDKKNRMLADTIEELHKETRNVPQSLYNLSRSTWKGITWAKIYPERRVLTIGDGKPREWTVISKVKDVDKRRFRLVQSYAAQGPAALVASGTATSQELRDAVRAAPGFNSPRNAAEAGYVSDAMGNFRWEFLRGYDGKTISGGLWDPIENVCPYDHWLTHVTDTSEQGLGYGYGLGDELQFFFWLKGSFLRWAAQAAERFGQGFLVAKTKALRAGMAKGMSQAAALQATVNVIRTWRSENFAAVDELTDVQLLDMPGEGMRWIYEWVGYLDRGMRQRILAALQPTGSGDGDGGFSSAKVEEGSTDDKVAYLRQPLEETWTLGPVRFLYEHNETNFRELGLWGLRLPDTQLKDKDTRNPEVMLKWFELAAKLRVPVRKRDFYECSKLTPPNEDDEAILYPEPIVSGAGLDDITQPFDAGEERRPVGEGGSAVGEKRSPEAAQSRDGHTRGNGYANGNGLASRMNRVAAHLQGVARQVEVFEQQNDRQLVLNFSPTLNVPEQKPPVVNVAAPNVSVNVPEQKRPVVNVEVPKQDPPVVNVKVPDQKPPTVNVNVPEQKAPDVNVRVDAPAAPVIHLDPVIQIPEQKPPVVNVEVPNTNRDKKTTYIKDKDGNITGSETRYAKE